MKKISALILGLLICYLSEAQNGKTFTIECDKGQTLGFNVLGGDSVELAYFGFTYYSETASVSSTITYNGKNYRITSIADGVFQESGLRTIELPVSLKRIGEEAFLNCTELQSIYIPDSVTYIGNYAFEGCRNIETIRLSYTPTGNITMIDENSYYIEGASMFYGCTGVRKIIMAKKINSVSTDAFTDCQNLEHIEVESGNMHFTSIDGILYDADTTSIVWYPQGRKGHLDIPAPTTHITNAYSYFNNIDSVTIAPGNKKFSMDGGLLYNGDTLIYCSHNAVTCSIPNTTTYIEYSAFWGCNNLKSVSIPANIKTILPDHFYNSKNLESITVDDANKFYCSIDGVLYNAAKTEIIAYPICKKGNLAFAESTQTIGNYAFMFNNNITEVVLPNTIQNIGNYAFYNCENISSITIPGSVTSIGTASFYNCKNLAEVTIENGVKNIGDAAFTYCEKLESIELPNSLQKIGIQSFGNCTNLESVKVGNELKSIGDLAFLYCGKLQSINIPKSVTTIGQLAFYGTNGINIYCEAKSKPSGWNVNWNANYNAAVNVIWSIGEDDDSAIGQETASNISIYACGSNIVVENATSDVTVYNIMGQLICKSATHNGSIEMHMQKTGIYIVKTGDVTQRVAIQK